VEDCQVDYATGMLTVSSGAIDLHLEPIALAVERAGYRLATQDRGESRGDRHADRRLPAFLRFILSRRETTLMVVAGMLAIIGLVLSLAGLYVESASWLTGSATVLYAAAIVLGGYPVARHAFQELFVARTIGINLLMVVAVTGAVLIGEWAEAAIVVVLFALGEALEGYATERSRRQLDNLLDLAPPVALVVLPGGETRETRVEQIQVGQRVLVRPGDRVSVDGIVQAGNSAVDQSPITGESVPVEKRPGDEVYAGTINTHAALEVEVTHPASDSTLNRMVQLVQQAQAQQAPVQRFIDRFARVYTPAVAAVALLVAAIPPLLFGQPFWGEGGWLMRALQMLVIACPCALVISTPVSLVSAMTNAASRGVLVKGGRYLEALSRVRVFAFDKTGTLTAGAPVVTDVISVCECGECHLDCGLEYASAVEMQSSHPMARALVAEAEARNLTIPQAESVVELGGRGIEGTVNGVEVTVASHAHFDEDIPHDAGTCQLADELSTQGKTAVLVRHDDEVCTLFGIADTPRMASRDALAALKAGGDIHTVMLTGDHPVVATEIARQIGVDEVRAGLLPEDKMTAVTSLTEQFGPVAMVGDGVNDAPALARADVGIAMGGAASAQAMETADVVLMGEDLSQLPFLVRLSRKTKRVVTANIVFALTVKAIVFALALTGQATLWMAIIADVGATIAVILNGMRLRRVS
jgi:Cd2+/Zn2+-exporting ATPase